MSEGHNIFYQNDEFHTLSLYLHGGNNNSRHGKPGKKGVSGSFCFMPQQQDSVWHIEQKVEFAHLYFSHDLLRRFAASTYQMDSRFIELQEQTFRQDTKLKQLFLPFFQAKKRLSSENAILQEQMAHEVLHHVLSRFNVFDVKCDIKFGAIQGGLSSSHRKKVIDQINDRLNEKLTIEALAKSVCLSPFHFAKMFKLSFGETPAHFINWMRVEKAKQLLKSKAPLSDISLQTGFSQQSHMTSNFKALTGMTPARYRKQLSSA